MVQAQHQWYTRNSWIQELYFGFFSSLLIWVVCRIKPPESQLKVTLKWGRQKTKTIWNPPLGFWMPCFTICRVIRRMLEALVALQRKRTELRFVFIWTPFLDLCGGRFPFSNFQVVTGGQSYDFQTFLISIIKTAAPCFTLFLALDMLYLRNIKTDSIFLAMHFLLSVGDVLWRYAVSNWHFAY